MTPLTDQHAATVVVRLGGGGAAVVAARGRAFTAAHCLRGLRVGDVSQGLRLIRVWRRWDLALFETARPSTLRLAAPDTLRPTRPVTLVGWTGEVVTQPASLTQVVASRARAIGNRDVCSGDSGSPVLQGGRLIGILIATTGPTRGTNRRCATTAIFTRLDALAVRCAIDAAWTDWMA